MSAQYSDQQKADVLLLLKANGENYCLTSRATGVPRQTIWRWAHGSAMNPDITALVTEKTPTLASTCEELAEKLLRVAAGRAEDMPPAQAILGFCQLMDKALLLRGEPTEIADNRHTLTSDQALVLSRLTPEQRDEYEEHLAGIARLQSGSIGPDSTPDEKLEMVLDGAGDPQRGPSSDVPIDG